MGAPLPEADPAQAEYQVLLLHLGESRSVKKRNIVADASRKQRTSMAWHAWLVAGKGRRIMIDTGLRAGHGARRYAVNDLATAAEVLRAARIDPGSITDVVLTHGHWDHTAGLADFPAATVYLARQELDFVRQKAAAPKGRSAGVNRADAALLEQLLREGRLVLVDPPVELIEGIEMVPVGGHTPGSVVVRIAQPDAPLVLASDAAYLFENIVRQVPIRDTWDAAASERALAVLDELAGGQRHRIVPGHEPDLAPQHIPVAPRLYRLSSFSVEASR